MYDLEGINKLVSETQRNIELSDSVRDYFNEIIPKAEDWNAMSESEKRDTWQIIESRMYEISDLANVCEADVAKLLPYYINKELEHCELPFCDEEEYFTRSEWAVKEFYKNETYRDIPYSDANVKLRAAYMEDFYDSFSEFSGNKPSMSFREMQVGNMGAYNPETNTITLNSRLLETENPNELMNTILHESRHAYQYYAIEYPDKVTVSEETIAEWKDNFEYYIRPEWDFEAYVSQPVEADANDFANKVMSGGYSYLA